jgi:very-short-patch-repair endonuclease
MIVLFSEARARGLPSRPLLRLGFGAGLDCSCDRLLHVRRTHRLNGRKVDGSQTSVDVHQHVNGVRRERRWLAHFRRQVVGNRCLVDFLAPARRLILVDGGYHASRRAADARRDRKLARLGYRVLRLPEALVREQPEDAVALVVAALAEPP